MSDQRQTGKLSPSAVDDKGGGGSKDDKKNKKGRGGPDNTTLKGKKDQKKTQEEINRDKAFSFRDDSQMKLRYGDAETDEPDEAQKASILKFHTEHKPYDDLEKHLDYILFPNIMGWYFDGFYDTPFGLNEKYAEHFNKLQAEYDEQEDYEHEETFTEKVYRNFWPPKYKMGAFRTRGIYLDFDEVLKDPPKTPPDINYERKREPIGVAGDDWDEEVLVEAEGVEGTGRKIVSHAAGDGELKKFKRRRRKIVTRPLDPGERPPWSDPSGYSKPQKNKECEQTNEPKVVNWTSSNYTTCERRLQFDRPTRIDLGK